VILHVNSFVKVVSYLILAALLSGHLLFSFRGVQPHKAIWRREEEYDERGRCGGSICPR
jgi:hypothetical protein